MLTTLATLASRTSTELITDFTMLRHILKQPAKKLLADLLKPAVQEELQMTSRFLHVARSRRRLEDSAAALGIGWSDARTALERLNSVPNYISGLNAPAQLLDGLLQGKLPTEERVTRRLVIARSRARIKEVLEQERLPWAACADALDGDSDGAERLSHAELREGLRTPQAFLKDLIHSSLRRHEMTAKGLVLGALEWKEAFRVEHPGHGFVWSEVRPALAALPLDDLRLGLSDVQTMLDLLRAQQGAAAIAEPTAFAEDGGPRVVVERCQPFASQRFGGRVRVKLNLRVLSGSGKGRSASGGGEGGPRVRRVAEERERASKLWAIANAKPTLLLGMQAQGIAWEAVRADLSTLPLQAVTEVCRQPHAYLAELRKRVPMPVLPLPPGAVSTSGRLGGAATSGSVPYVGAPAAATLSLAAASAGLPAAVAPVPIHPSPPPSPPFNLNDAPEALLERLSSEAAAQSPEAAADNLEMDFEEADLAHDQAPADGQIHTEDEGDEAEIDIPDELGDIRVKERPGVTVNQMGRLTLETIASLGAPAFVIDDKNKTIQITAWEEEEDDELLSGSSSDRGLLDQCISTAGSCMGWCLGSDADSVRSMLSSASLGPRQPRVSVNGVLREGVVFRTLDRPLPRSMKGKIQDVWLPDLTDKRNARFTKADIGKRISIDGRGVVVDGCERNVVWRENKRQHCDGVIRDVEETPPGNDDPRSPEELPGRRDRMYVTLEGGKRGEAPLSFEKPVLPFGKVKILLPSKANEPHSVSGRRWSIVKQLPRQNMNEPPPYQIQVKAVSAVLGKALAKEQRLREMEEAAWLLRNNDLDGESGDGSSRPPQEVKPIEAIDLVEAEWKRAMDGLRAELRRDLKPTDYVVLEQGQGRTFLSPRPDADIVEAEFELQPMQNISDLVRLGQKETQQLAGRLHRVLHTNWIKQFYSYCDAQSSKKEAILAQKKKELKPWKGMIEDGQAEREARAVLAKWKRKVPKRGFRYWASELMPALVVMVFIQGSFAVLFWYLLPPQPDGTPYTIWHAIFHCILVATKASSVTQKWLNTQELRVVAIFHMLLTFASLLCTIDEIVSSMEKRIPYAPCATTPHNQSLVLGS